MMLEIAVAMDSGTISYNDACALAAKVIDRFRNPFLDHKWLSITMNYTSKMKMRNIPLLQQFYCKTGKIPCHMALGFAAYIVFMKCSVGNDKRYYGQANRQSYLAEDEAAAYFAEKWTLGNKDEVADEILGDKNLWGIDLSGLNGFADAVKANIKLIQREGILSALNSRQLQQTTV